MTLFDCSDKRTGHLLSFFVLTPGDLTAKESPPPGICHPRQKKQLMPRGGGEGGWAQQELTDALVSKRNELDYS